MKLFVVTWDVGPFSVRELRAIEDTPKAIQKVFDTIHSLSRREYIITNLRVCLPT